MLWPPPFCLLFIYYCSISFFVVVVVVAVVSSSTRSVSRRVSFELSRNNQKSFVSLSVWFIRVSVSS